MILPILLCLSATYLIEQTLAAVQVTGYNRLPSSISVHAGGASPRGFPVLWDTAVIIPNGNDLSNEYLITSMFALFEGLLSVKDSLLKSNLIIHRNS